MFSQFLGPIATRTFSRLLTTCIFEILFEYPRNLYTAIFKRAPAKDSTGRYATCE